MIEAVVIGMLAGLAVGFFLGQQFYDWRRRG